MRLFSNSVLSRKVILVLFLVATIIYTFRIALENFSSVPENRESAWEMTWEFNLNSTDKNTSFDLYLPRETTRISLYSQSLQHPGLRVKRITGRGQNRVLTITAKDAGNYRFRIIFGLFIHARDYNNIPVTKVLKIEERREYEKIDDDDPLLQPFIGMINKIGSQNETESEIAEQIYMLTRDTFNSAKLPVNKRDELLARSMVVLARTNFLPARLVTGFSLSVSGKVLPQYWAEVWINNGWISFDPADGYAYAPPVNYVPVRRSEISVINIPDNARVTSQFFVRKQSIPAGLFEHESRFIDVFDFTRLSYIDREILALLMLLPLGGLLTAFLRRIIGMRPFGTFAPTLLALSVSIGDWITVAIIFVIITIFGVIGRAMIPGLRLSRLPRLAIVFALISISMVFSISLLRYFNMETGEINTLLPMAVMTILVDSFYRTADSEGLKAGLARMIWTLIVSSLIFMVFVNPELGFIFLSFPEFHLITIALIILVGSYNDRTFLDKYIKTSVVPGE